MNDIEFMMSCLADFFVQRLNSDSGFALLLREQLVRGQVPAVTRLVGVPHAETGRPAVQGSLLISVIRSYD